MHVDKSALSGFAGGEVVEADDFDVATVVGNNWSYTAGTLADGRYDIMAMVQNAGDSSGTAGRVVSGANYLQVLSSASVPTQTVTITSATDNVNANGSLTGLVTSNRTTDDSTLALSGTLSAATTANQVVAVYDGAIKLGNASMSGIEVHRATMGLVRRGSGDAPLTAATFWLNAIAAACPNC